MAENSTAATESYPLAPSDAAQRIRRYGAWIAVGVIAVILLVLLTPIATVAVWDGRFELTIHVDSDPAIDLESVRFVTCGRRNDANSLLSETNRKFSIPWSDSSRNSATNDWTIAVRCSGRSNWTGIGDTYIEKRFLVVEYESTASGEGARHRKQLLIPQGRGPRSMAIELP